MTMITTLTARLRELNDAYVSRYDSQQACDIQHTELRNFLWSNRRNIIRLLEAGDGAECALRIIAGEEQCIDNLMSNSDVARSALATLRAAREGAR